ncbi:MAG: triose-phosphate isomerase [Candidatus Micrarchaeota archaeon]
MIVLNLKTYQESIEKTMQFVEIAEEVAIKTKVRIIVCPPVTSLANAAWHYAGFRCSETYAQHVDHTGLGAHTGSIPAEALKYLKVKGSLVNHSEKRIGMENIAKTIESLHKNGLESLVCAESPKEAETIAKLNPKYIAIEPPELIGSGISVSNAKPEVVTNTVKLIEKANPKVIVLCGAGVSNKEDTKKALQLGAKGVLLASAFVKAKNPKKFLEELVSVF